MLPFCALRWMCTCVYDRDIIGNTAHHIRILSVLLRSGQWGEYLPDVLSSGIWQHLCKNSVCVISIWCHCTLVACHAVYITQDSITCKSFNFALVLRMNCAGFLEYLTGKCWRRSEEEIGRRIDMTTTPNETIWHLSMSQSVKIYLWVMLYHSDMWDLLLTNGVSPVHSTNCVHRPCHQRGSWSWISSHWDDQVQTTETVHYYYYYYYY